MLGVVMEGGASRTIFSCGVCEVLMENNIYPDYFIGVSAGVAYGVSYISGQKGRNKEFSSKFMHLPKYMGFHHLLNPKKRCYYNLDFAFDEIPNKLTPFDYKAFAEFPGRKISTVTNIETGQTEYLDIPDYEYKWQTTIASCGLPILFQPIELPSGRYLDGGITDAVPFKKAISEGCDKVIVILTREREYVKEKESRLIMSLMKIACRKMPAVYDAMVRRDTEYNRQRKELFEYEKEGKVFIIAPDDTLGVRRTEGDWNKMGPLYEEGIKIARAIMPSLEKYLNS